MECPRREALGLSEDELAFREALEKSDSGVNELDHETLRSIAHELVKTVRKCGVGCGMNATSNDENR